jgi:hypothetical protein
MLSSTSNTLFLNQEIINGEVPAIKENPYTLFCLFLPIIIVIAIHYRYQKFLEYILCKSMLKMNILTLDRTTQGSSIVY